MPDQARIYQRRPEHGTPTGVRFTKRQLEKNQKFFGFVEAPIRTDIRQPNRIYAFSVRYMFRNRCSNRGSRAGWRTRMNSESGRVVVKTEAAKTMHNLRRKSREQNEPDGFTLLELLVVTPTLWPLNGKD